jgi:hypothetical protein
MRFLCLHGRGTNSDIFESQLGKEVITLREKDAMLTTFLVPSATILTRLPSTYL